MLPAGERSDLQRRSSCSNRVKLCQSRPSKNGGCQREEEVTGRSMSGRASQEYGKSTFVSDELTYGRELPSG